MRRLRASLISLLSMLAGVALLPAAGSAQTSGFVYVATNSPSGNAIVQYGRAANGSLTRLHTVSTGGRGGTGNGVGNLDPLGSQDSLVLNGTGNLLLAVNAGSNQLSSLTVSAAGPHLASLVSSHGVFPNSVALHGNLVYVLNAHGTPNISGFRVNASGVLMHIAGSTRALPGGASSAAHDIGFSPDGTRLLVTEGGTNRIDVFMLNSSGLVTKVVTQASAGSGPFGFRFGRAGVLVNAEANSNSVSSYMLTSEDTLNVVSPAVGDGQMATCWITLTGDGKFGFVSNTASGNLSAYTISGNGTLTLANAIAGTLNGGAPIDSALSDDGSFLYVDDSALGRVVSFRVHGASLVPVGSVGGLPTTLQGIAVQ